MIIVNKSFLIYSGYKQQGAVLFVSLIMLLIVTIVGIGSMQSITLEEKMVSNQQNSTLAYHGAETALSVCEENLQDSAAGTRKAFNIGSLPKRWHEQEAVWNGVSTVVDYTGLPKQPRCVAEYVGMGGSDIEWGAIVQADTAAARPVFRVTSSSEGGNSHAQAILESMFICPGGCDQVSTLDYGASP